MDLNRVITGDVFDVIEDIPKNSVHAIVTDPPYGLAFMGKSWDEFDPKEYQEFSERWATEVGGSCAPVGTCWRFLGRAPTIGHSPGSKTPDSKSGIR